MVGTPDSDDKQERLYKEQERGKAKPHTPRQRVFRGPLTEEQERRKARPSEGDSLAEPGFSRWGRQKKMRKAPS